MNLLENYVTAVVSPPTQDAFTDLEGKEHVYWWVKVQAECYGSITESTLTFDTQEEATAVCEGYVFMG